MAEGALAEELQELALPGGAAEGFAGQDSLNEFDLGIVSQLRH